MFKIRSGKALQRILVIGLSLAIVVSIIDYNRLLHQSFRRTECVSDSEIHRLTVDGYFEKRRLWKTSNLGTTLFKNINMDIFDHLKRHDKTYMILMWRFWKEIQKNRRVDALEDCHVKNCIFSDDENDIHKADAVVIHMQISTFPKIIKRNVLQRWILLSEEDPLHSYILEAVPTIKHISHLFNWTMTYRTDSDVPIPKGRTVPLDSPFEVYLGNSEQALKKLVPHWDEKQVAVLLTIMITDCTQTDTFAYLMLLRKYMKVDIHGKCVELEYTKDNLINLGPQECHPKYDCKLAREYLFYLVLDNVSCRQYVTEKIFYHAYAKGAIPIIAGTPLKDCERMLPPNSFLHLDNFKSAAQLTSRLLTISSSFDEMLYFHRWRNHFHVANEHGIYDTTWPITCRVCEALNINDGEVNTYDTDELRLFFNKKLLCDFKYNLNPSTTTPKPEHEMIVFDTIKRVKE